MKKVGGGSVTDSFLVTGVAFKKTFSYAGFEQQPKSFDKPSILLLNVELELKSEKVTLRLLLRCCWPEFARPLTRPPPSDCGYYEKVNDSCRLSESCSTVCLNK